MLEFEVHLLDTRHLAMFADAARVAAEAQRDQVGDDEILIETRRFQLAQIVLHGAPIASGFRALG